MPGQKANPIKQLKHLELTYIPHIHAGSETAEAPLRSPPADRGSAGLRGAGRSRRGRVCSRRDAGGQPGTASCREGAGGS